MSYSGVRNPVVKMMRARHSNMTINVNNTSKQAKNANNNCYIRNQATCVALLALVLTSLAINCHALLLQQQQQNNADRHLRHKQQPISSQSKPNNNQQAASLPVSLSQQQQQEQYFGAKFGELSNRAAHNVSGTLFAVDEQTIFIRKFNFDGLAADTYFWSSVSELAPSAVNSFIVPDEKGSTKPLDRYVDKDVVLRLPEGRTLREIRWLSVWSRAANDASGASLGDIAIDAKSLSIPRPFEAPNLSSLAHGVRSGPVTLVDAQTLLIADFHYDGLAPDAHFWLSRAPRGVGVETNIGLKANGVKLRDENGSSAPLKKYSGETIVVSLPDELTLYDFDYFGVWCVSFGVDFGHTIIPHQPKVPPSPRMLGIKPENKLNCEILFDDLGYEVRWVLDGDDIVMQLVGKIEQNEYMAFGLGKDDSRSDISNADAVVAWVDRNSGQVHAADYLLNPSVCAKHQALATSTWINNDTINSNKSNASTQQSIGCSDTKLPGGTDSLTLLHGAIVNGYSMVTFKRPQLGIDDTYDQHVYSDGQQSVVWAIGVLVGRTRAEVGASRLQTRGSMFMDFARTPLWNCPVPDLNATMSAGATAAGNAASLASSSPAVTPTGSNQQHFTQPASTGQQQQQAASQLAVDSVLAPAGVSGIFAPDPAHHTVPEPERRGASVNAGSLGTPTSSRDDRWHVPAIVCPTERVFRAQLGPAAGRKAAAARNASSPSEVAQAVVWYINGLLLPELVLERGLSYKFVVEGGNDKTNVERRHPLYLTDAEDGGFDFKTDSERQAERVFAGVAIRSSDGQFAPTAEGRLCEWRQQSNSQLAPDLYPTFAAFQRSLKLECAPGQQASFKFTPDQDTPSVIYYQDYTHQQLGWRIRIVDSCANYLRSLTAASSSPSVQHKANKRAGRAVQSQTLRLPRHNSYGKNSTNILATAPLASNLFPTINSSPPFVVSNQIHTKYQAPNHFVVRRYSLAQDPFEVEASDALKVLDNTLVSPDARNVFRGVAVNDIVGGASDVAADVLLPLNSTLLKQAAAALGVPIDELIKPSDLETIDAADVTSANSVTAEEQQTLEHLLAQQRLQQQQQQISSSIPAIQQQHLATTSLSPVAFVTANSSDTQMPKKQRLPSFMSLSHTTSQLTKLPSVATSTLQSYLNKFASHYLRSFPSLSKPDSIAATSNQKPALGSTGLSDNQQVMAAAASSNSFDSLLAQMQTSLNQPDQQQNSPTNAAASVAKSQQMQSSSSNNLQTKLTNLLVIPKPPKLNIDLSKANLSKKLNKLRFKSNRKQIANQADLQGNSSSTSVSTAKHPPPPIPENEFNHDIFNNKLAQLEQQQRQLEALTTASSWHATPQMYPQQQQQQQQPAHQHLPEESLISQEPQQSNLNYNQAPQTTPDAYMRDFLQNLYQASTPFASASNLSSQQQTYQQQTHLYTTSQLAQQPQTQKWQSAMPIYYPTLQQQQQQLYPGAQADVSSVQSQPQTGGWHQKAPQVTNLHKQAYTTLGSQINFKEQPSWPLKPQIHQNYILQHHMQPQVSAQFVTDLDSKQSSIDTNVGTTNQNLVDYMIATERFSKQPMEVQEPTTFVNSFKGPNQHIYYSDSPMPPSNHFKQLSNKYSPTLEGRNNILSNKNNIIVGTPVAQAADSMAVEQQQQQKTLKFSDVIVSSKEELKPLEQRQQSTRSSELLSSNIESGKHPTANYKTEATSLVASIIECNDLQNCSSSVFQNNQQTTKEPKFVDFFRDGSVSSASSSSELIAGSNEIQAEASNLKLSHNNSTVIIEPLTMEQQTSPTLYKSPSMPSYGTTIETDTHVTGPHTSIMPLIESKSNLDTSAFTPIQITSSYSPTTTPSVSSISQTTTVPSVTTNNIPDQSSFNNDKELHSRVYNYNNLNKHIDHQFNPIDNHQSIDPLNDYPKHFQSIYDNRQLHESSNTFITERNKAQQEQQIPIAAFLAQHWKNFIPITSSSSMLESRLSNGYTQTSSNQAYNGNNSNNLIEAEGGYPSAILGVTPSYRDLIILKPTIVSSPIQNQDTLGIRGQKEKLNSEDDILTVNDDTLTSASATAITSLQTGSLNSPLTYVLKPEILLNMQQFSPIPNNNEQQVYYQHQKSTLQSPISTTNVMYPSNDVASRITHKFDSSNQQPIALPLEYDMESIKQALTNITAKDVQSSLPVDNNQISQVNNTNSSEATTNRQATSPAHPLNGSDKQTSSPPGNAILSHVMSIITSHAATPIQPAANPFLDLNSTM